MKAPGASPGVALVGGGASQTHVQFSVYNTCRGCSCKGVGVGKCNSIEILKLHLGVQTRWGWGTANSFIVCVKKGGLGDLNNTNRGEREVQMTIRKTNKLFWKAKGEMFGGRG